MRDKKTVNDNVIIPCLENSNVNINTLINNDNNKNQSILNNSNINDNKINNNNMIIDNANNNINNINNNVIIRLNSVDKNIIDSDYEGDNDDDDDNIDDFLTGNYNSSRVGFEVKTNINLNDQQEERYRDENSLNNNEALTIVDNFVNYQDTNNVEINNDIHLASVGEENLNINGNENSSSENFWQLNKHDSLSISNENKMECVDGTASTHEANSPETDDEKIDNIFEDADNRNSNFYENGWKNNVEGDSVNNMNNNPTEDDEEESEITDTNDLGEILTIVVDNARKMEHEFPKYNNLENNNTIKTMNSIETDSSRITNGSLRRSSSSDRLFDDQGWIITDDELEIPISHNLTSKNNSIQEISDDDATNKLTSNQLMKNNENPSTDKNYETTLSEEWSLLNDTASSGDDYIEDNENLVKSTTDVSNEDNNSTRENDESNLTSDEDNNDDSQMTIPMKMVTTVFCISVLCYGVLTNLIF